MHVLLLPILAQAFSVTAGDTSMGRVRSDELGQHYDTSTVGSLSLSLALKRSDWTLTYSPGVTQLNLGESSSTLLLINSGSLTGNLRLTRRTTLSFAETGTYGRQNLQVLAANSLTTNSSPTSATSGGAGTTQTGTPGTGPSGSIVPANGSAVLAVPGHAIINFGSLSTMAGVSQILDRNWSARVYGSYAVRGQLGSTVALAESSQNYQYYPLTRSYAGNLMLVRAFSARDVLTLAVVGSHTSTEPVAEAVIAQATVSWNHGISASTSTTLSAGAAYVDSAVSAGVHTLAILPYGQLSISNARPLLGGRLRAFASVTTMPVVDAQYGSVYEALTSTAGGNWQKRQLSINVAAFGTSKIQSLGQVSLLAAYGLSESATYSLDRRRHWAVSVGSYQTWQSYTLNSQRSALWAGYLAISYTTLAISL